MTRDRLFSDPRFRDLAPYVVLLAILFLAVAVLRPDEHGLEQQTSFPWPEVAIDGLSVPAAADHPAFFAEHAQPGASGTVAVGGFRDRLELQGIRVTLAEDRSLTAETGHYSVGRLTLSARVRVEVEGRLVLEASQVVFRGGLVELPGVSVFRTPRGRDSAMNLTLTREEFVRRLRY